MAVPDLKGWWLSEIGRLVYTIIQLDDKFVLRVIHTNGVTETGIGWFPNADSANLTLDCQAQWNFHSGQLNQGIRRCNGTVVMTRAKATGILWSDGDNFQRVP